MSLTLPIPSFTIGESFPDHLFVLHHPASDRYGCFQYEGVIGLACFSQEKDAANFGSLIQLDGLTVFEVSFDEARDIAKARPLPVTSIMLLDEISRPLIHYVR
jgi:hypothetical protein